MRSSTDNNYKKCSQCADWQYNSAIERIYGQGTGVCSEDEQPKGCDRHCCLLFKEKTEV